MTVTQSASQSDRGGLDVGRLEAYCRGRLEAADKGFEVQPILGGSSNPTYVLTARASGKRYVLRKKPVGTLLPSAHQVEREHRVMAALGKTGFPVPVVRVLCEDTSVTGTAFYIMDFMEGRIFRRAALPELPAAQRAAIYDELNSVLARLHAIDYEAAGLGDFGRPGDYYQRQMARWVRQYEAAALGPCPEVDRLIAILQERLPTEETSALTHGDYRLENMIFHPTEPRILAVLDWELSTIGHPLADLAYNCLVYHSASEAFGTLKGYDTRGIPDEAAYVEAYCRRTGRASIPDWNFYLAFSQFRLMAIGAGVARRAMDGKSDPSRVGEGGGVAERARVALDMLGA